MSLATVKSDFFDWWEKEFTGGLFTFLFSIFMKAVIPIIFIAWLIKKLLLFLLLFPILIATFTMWEGKSRESFIQLAILLFPSVKILYLAQNLKKQGRITTKKAIIFFIFVTIVFLELAVLFLNKLFVLLGGNQSFISFVIPAALMVLVFIIFEAALIITFNLAARSSFYNPNKRSEELANAYGTKFFSKESDEESTKRTVDYLRSYGKNVAGHLPMNKQH